MSSHYFLFTICRKRQLKSTRAGLFDCFFNAFFLGLSLSGFVSSSQIYFSRFISRIAQLEDAVRRNQYALEKASEEQQVQAMLYSFLII